MLKAKTMSSNPERNLIMRRDLSKKLVFLTVNIEQIITKQRCKYKDTIE